MFRLLPLVCSCLLLFLSPLAASAKNATTPDPENTVCNGRYAAASEILQAMKYGTLYSGGDHFHVLDDVGQTVDMYRLWRGLPDWHLRAAGGDGTDEYLKSGGSVSFDWLLGNAPASGKSPAETSATVCTLDRKAAVTRPADAWLDDKETARLSPLELWLRFIMAASDAPWANIPIFRMDYALGGDFLRLRDETLRRYQGGEGIEWAVAAQLLDPIRSSQPQEADGIWGIKFSEKTAALDKIFADWQTKVLSCAATPQEYAAWAAVAPYRKPATEQIQAYRRFLPDILFRQWAEYWSRWSVEGILLTTLTKRDWDRLDVNLITNIASYIDDPDQLSWFDAGLSFFLVRPGPSFIEKDMAKLLTHYKGRRIHPITAARFNMLSPEHLLRLAREGELSKDMQCGLLGSAFARYVTDGQNAKAFPLIEEIFPCFPDETRKRLAAIVHRDVPLNVKNALFSLYAPLVSTWFFYDDMTGGQSSGSYSGTHDEAQQIANRAFDTMTATETVSDYAVKRDLPRRFVSGEKFTRDKGEWLLHPDYWGLFWGMHGYSVDFMDRIARNDGQYLREGVRQGRSIPAVPAIPPENTEADLARYGGGNGFSHALSVTIIRWAEAEEKKWFRKWFRSAQEKAEMAEALARVVRMNRYNDGGILDGKPVSQRAFWLLHRYYPDSEAAKSTRYWYQATGALNW